MKYIFVGKSETLPQEAKDYIRVVEKNLCMAPDFRNNVVGQMAETLADRISEGETWESIRRELGDPAARAEKLNDDNAADSFRRSPGRWVFLAIAALCALAMILVKLLADPAAQAQGLAVTPLLNLGLGLGLVIGAMGYLMLGHLKRK